MQHRFKRPLRAAIAGLAVAMTVALAGCSDSGGDNDSADGTGKPLRVAVLGFADFLLPYIAEEQGYFEDEGVDVEIVVAGGASSVQIPQVLNGEFELGVAGLADVLPSIAQGLPLSVVANVGSNYIADIDKATNVYLAKDPAIKEPCDLEGKKVGMQTIGASQELAVRTIVKADGCDPDKVTFVQVPATNIPASIESGQIDAGQGFEPYLTVGLDLGLNMLFTDGEAYEGAPAVTYFANRELPKTRSADLDAFARAMARAADLVTKDPEIIRQAILDHTETDPALVEKATRFTAFTSDLDIDKYEFMQKFLLENDRIEKEVPVKDWVYVPQL